MIFQCVLLMINVLMAFWHSILIKQRKPILHGLWTAIYIALTLALIWIFKMNLFYGLGLGVLIRALFFDICLNLFRELPITYKSLTTTSIWDKLTNKIPFWPLRLIYLILIVVLNFLMWNG